MISLLPRSTLFPYTTLFRSVLTYNQNGTTHQLHVSGGFIEVSDDRVSVLAEIAERPEEIDAARARLAREHTEKQDRKSTRLNSSHLGISYAVFCLKKKK